MKLEDCFYLGKIGKPKSFKGETTLIFDVDEVDFLSNVDIWFILIANRLVPYSIENLYPKNNKTLVVKFKGINDDRNVDLLKNKEVYLPVTCLPKLEKGEVYLHELIGCEVLDDNYGNIGEIKGVNDQTSQRLLIVKKGKKEILIPYIDQFVYKKDISNKTINTNLPEGFMDIF
jgi:16S rRNA processing protein RimM